MTTISPAVLNAHTLNITMKVSPANFNQQDRIAFFTWLDGMIRGGTTEAKRDSILFETLCQLSGDAQNTILHRNRELPIASNFWGRRKASQIPIVQTVVKGLLETGLLPKQSVVGRSEQLIDLFHSMVALLASDAPREDVAQMVREYLEPDIVRAMPQTVQVRPAKISP